MIVSSHDLEKNITKTVNGIARELATRVRVAGVSETDSAIVEVEAQKVLIDWFLGDFIPNEQGKQAGADPATPPVSEDKSDS